MAFLQARFLEDLSISQTSRDVPSIPSVLARLELNRNFEKCAKLDMLCD
jgi:hypothetical protein